MPIVALLVMLISGCGVFNMEDIKRCKVKEQGDGAFESNATGVSSEDALNSAHDCVSEQCNRLGAAGEVLKKESQSHIDTDKFEMRCGNSFREKFQHLTDCEKELEMQHNTSPYQSCYCQFADSPTYWTALMQFRCVMGDVRLGE